MTRIEALRNKKQLELIEKKTGFNLKDIQKKDFFLYFSRFAKDTVYTGCLKNLKEFARKEFLYFEELDYKYCQKFAEYLITKVRPNSAVSYYSKFKFVLNKAVKEGIIQISPALNVSIKGEDTKREYLTLEEIRTLAGTEKPDIDTCNAFLFSCF
ncbi:MAG: phage integrase SAM-like domain-containing protein, partial [Candidatus Delongbacteria bacterium]|nr:phage integrase SAM-like domain-containing protein [Candidatus Delongbacteria bacterium]